MPTLTRATLLERVESTAHRVDRERGIIRDVKALGRDSKNGRTYSEQALRDAARLFEGAKVNIDHPARSTPAAERGFGEGFGVLRNIRIKADGVYGDLHYLRSHKMAEQVCEAAERFPASFGLSMNADGELGRSHGGRAIVEAVTKVRSVDIVGVPATTSGLFESYQSPQRKRATTMRTEQYTPPKNLADWANRVRGFAGCVPIIDRRPLSEQVESSETLPSLKGDRRDDAPVATDEDDGVNKLRAAFEELFDAGLSFDETLSQAREILDVLGDGDEGEDEEELAESYRPARNAADWARRLR